MWLLSSWHTVLTSYIVVTFICDVFFVKCSLYKFMLKKRKIDIKETIERVAGEAFFYTIKNISLGYIQ